MSTPLHRLRRRAGALLAAVLMLGAIGFTTPAAAAELDAITDVVVTWPTSPTVVGSSVRVDATWAVPASARAGDTFSLTLPTEPRFDARAIAPFSMKDPDGVSIGTCVVTPSVITCTLTDAVDAMANVHGSLFFWAVATQESSTTEVTFTTSAGVTFTIPTPDGVGPAPSSSPYRWPTVPTKAGYSLRDNSAAHWAVYLTDAMVADSAMITDTFDPALTFDPASVRIYAPSREVWTSDDPWRGRYLPTSAFHVLVGAPLDSNQFQVWIEPSAVTADTMYIVAYDTAYPADAVDGQAFNNSIVVVGAGTAASRVTFQGAGGDGRGDLAPTTPPTPDETVTPSPVPTTPEEIAAPSPEPVATPEPPVMAAGVAAPISTPALAATGSSAPRLAGGAAILAAAGVTLLFAARRRTNTEGA